MGVERPRCRRTRGVGKSQTLHIDPETSAFAETRSGGFTTRTSSQSFSSQTHKDANTTRRRTRDRTQRTATHHATDAPSRAAAAEHNKGSPLPIKIEGSLA